MNAVRSVLAVAFLLSAVVSCGSRENPEGFDGSLDCGAAAWSVTIPYLWEHEGEITPYDAMVDWSTVYDDYQPRVHVDSARTGTVVIDGSEVVVMQVIELPTETFEVIEAEGCQGYEPPSYDDG